MRAQARLDAPPANDNGAGARDQSKPTVSVPGGRRESTYACAGNLILPLRFARRFAGWRSSPHSQR